MSDEDQKAFKLYGKVPGKNVLTKMQKVYLAVAPYRQPELIRQDRKYFDSGDYMMNKAGVQSAQAPGTAIPTPEGYAYRSITLDLQTDITGSLTHSHPLLVPLHPLPPLLPAPSPSHQSIGTHLRPLRAKRSTMIDCHHRRASELGSAPQRPARPWRFLVEVEDTRTLGE